MKRKLSILSVIIGVCVMIFSYFYYGDLFFKKETMFLASDTSIVSLYDENFTMLENVYRGKEVLVYEDKYVSDEKEFYRIKLYKKEYYVLINNLVSAKDDIFLEKYVYVRTPSVLYSDIDNGFIFSLAKKGDKLEIVDAINLQDDGIAEYYKVLVNDEKAYIYGKYVVFDEESALFNYDADGNYLVHAERGNTLGGGSAGTLDYYPREKKEFENNVMPDPVYALFLNSYSITPTNVDDYINLAKQSKINTFVVDIKDNTSPGYKSEVMKEYSPTNYNNANKSAEEYGEIISKLKESGFYVIGRITVFKDSYFVRDHPEYAIMNTITNQPFKHDGQYWPSAYQRDVWEFNVNLAKEAVDLFGFDEIQFDYVRFPDRTSDYEVSGIMDFRNNYDESKAEAIQRFLMYATDELHKKEVYVSADVFGESAHEYVTAYGQYWPAISNVVDVISAMPYPDHFNKYQYDFNVPVWTVPYDLLYHWGSEYVMKRQEEIDSPAKLRTWIQAYDVVKDPATEYNAPEIEAQVRALFDAGLRDGYMTWNVSSNIDRYTRQLPAYQIEYK